MADARDREDSAAATEATRRVAEAFAAALDSGDLVAAGRLLAPYCACYDGVLEVRGDEAVLALYRAAARWAEHGFDEVRHVSTVTDVHATNACVAVTTYLMRVPAGWHRLHHARQLDVAPDGRIVRIVHACDAEAAAAFRVFVAGCEVSAPPPGFGVH